MILIFLSCNYNYSTENKNSPDLKVKPSHLKKTLNKKTTLNMIKKHLYNIKKYLYDNYSVIFPFAVMFAISGAITYKYGLIETQYWINNNDFEVSYILMRFHQRIKTLEIKTKHLKINV